MGPKHFQNKARREWWSIHIGAWQRSGVSQAAYCRQFRFDEKTFTRWLQHLAGEEAARKLVAYQTELRRDKRREEREKGLKKRQRQRNSVSTDVNWVASSRRAKQSRLRLVKPVALLLLTRIKENALRDGSRTRCLSIARCATDCWQQGSTGKELHAEVSPRSMRSITWCADQPTRQFLAVACALL